MGLKTRLMHKENGRYIDLIPNECTFYVNEQAYRFGDVTQANIALAVANSPDLISYDCISEMLKKLMINCDMNYIRQKISHIGKALRNSTGHDGIIINVRLQGYKISSEWSVVNISGEGVKLQNYIDLCENLINICIDRVNEGKFIVDDHGLIAIEIEETVVDENINTFNYIFKNIFSYIFHEKKMDVPERIAHQVEIIASYISFRRTGANITPADWRKIFEREIRHHFERLRADLLTLVEGGAVAPPSGDPDPPKRVRFVLKNNLHAIRLITRDYKIPPGRQLLIESVDGALDGARQGGLAIAVVQGRWGIGKTQLIAEWWHAAGSEYQWGTIVTLDCSRSPGDRILRKLNQHFLGREQETVSDGLISAINAVERPLIVLDGLVKDRPYSKPSNSVAPTEADEIALRRVRELVCRLAEGDTDATILLAIQTERPAQDALGILAQLHAGISYSVIPAPELSDDDGAFLMRQLGVTDVPTEDLRRISHRLLGLPMSIIAAANHLMGLDETAREDFIIRLATPPHELSDFKQFCDLYIQNFSAAMHISNAHPHAFLRLLALMPGPVPRTRLANLLAGCTVNRLGPAALDGLLRQNLVFVSVQGELIDIHPFLRYVLREELQQICSGRHADPDTTRDEIARIHAHAAYRCLQDLPASEVAFSVDEADTIEGAVYHLLSLRDLLQEPNAGDAALDDRVSTFIGFEERLLRLEVSAAEVTKFCLSRIVWRYVLGRRPRLTRILGQFETKARILTYFFEGNVLTGAVRNLTAEDTRRVLFEIGICWMHAGRLNLSHQALGRSALAVTRGAQFGVPEKGEERRWADRTEIVATQSLVMARQGRHADDVLDLFGRDMTLAQSLAEDALRDKAGLASDVSDELLQAARRLIARHAHLMQMRGDLDTALAEYALATALEESISHRTYLDGDAARRYVQALVRAGRRGAGLAEKMGGYLQSLEEWCDKPAARGHQANEIVPLLTLRAMLLRIDGDYETAQRVLHEASTHEHVRTGQCPYAGRIELRLEALRLQIASGQATEATIRSARELTARLAESHHPLYQTEGSLLIAELVNGREQEELLRECEGILRPAKWMLRIADVTEIRNAGSALARYGC